MIHLEIAGRPDEVRQLGLAVAGMAADAVPEAEAQALAAWLEARLVGAGPVVIDYAPARGGMTLEVRGLGGDTAGDEAAILAETGVETPEGRLLLRVSRYRGHKALAAAPTGVPGVHLTLASRLADICLVEQSIRAMATPLIGVEAGAALSLAVVEAATNVVKHAYRGGPEGRLALHWRQGPRGMEIVLRDWGLPMDPLAFARQGWELPEPSLDQESGWGMYIIRSSTDELTYRRCAGVNMLTLCKYLPAEEDSAAGEEGDGPLD